MPFKQLGYGRGLSSYQLWDPKWILTTIRQLHGSHIVGMVIILQFIVLHLLLNILICLFSLFVLSVLLGKHSFYFFHRSISRMAHVRLLGIVGPVRRVLIFVFHQYIEIALSYV